MDELKNGFQHEPVTKVRQEGEKSMMDIETRVSELDVEIATYRQAIEDAEAALDSAEKELNEVLAELPS